MVSIRTPLAVARGLGSARDGTHHFWMQRLTALALIPLSLWFVYSLLTTVLNGDIGDWLGIPHNAILMAFFLIALFYHSRLGIQVIIEDYVHAKFSKFSLIILSEFLHFTFTVISLVAVLKIHLSPATHPSTLF